MDRQVKAFVQLLAVMPNRFADGVGTFHRRGTRIYLHVGRDRYLVAILAGQEILIQQTLPGFWARPDEPNAA
jgi:hypothetical protein